MNYRELHCDSSLDGQSGQNKNHPTFTLDGPLYIDKFALKEINIPFTLHNFPVDNTFRMSVTTGAFVYYPIEVNRTRTFPAGQYTIDEFLLEYNRIIEEWRVAASRTGAGATLLSTLVGSIIASIDGNGRVVYTMTSAGEHILTTNNRITLEFVGNNGTRNSYQLQRRLGHGNQNTIKILTPPVITLTNTVATFTSFAIDLATPKYLMLRSSLGSGSSFLQNVRGKESMISGSNIIAKIPLDIGNVGYGDRYYYKNGDNLSHETMFTYNGGYITNFDFYFTGPHSEEEIDFQDYTFDLTLALLTGQHQ